MKAMKVHRMLSNPRGPDSKKYVIGPGLKYLGGRISCLCDVKIFNYY